MGVSSDIYRPNDYRMDTAWATREEKEMIKLAVLVVMLFGIAACSTHHTIRVGDSTYSAGIIFNKRTNNE